MSDGDAIISARDSTQATGTYPVRVTGNTIPFPEDITQFTNYNWNGWELGPAGVNPTSQIVLDSGNYRYQNRTPSGYVHTGVVLQKKYVFNVGKRYHFSFAVLNRNEVQSYLPTLSVNAGSAVVIAPTKLGPVGWMTLTGVFTATSRDTWVQINSHEGTHSGNDYEIDAIYVTELKTTRTM